MTPRSRLPLPPRTAVAAALGSHAFGSAKAEATEAETEEGAEEGPNTIVAGPPGARQGSCPCRLQRVVLVKAVVFAIRAGPLPPVYAASMRRGPGKRVGPAS